MGEEESIYMPDAGILGDRPSPTKKLEIQTDVTILSGLRPSCQDCARKHLGQAIVLFSEAKQGYRAHFWIAIGHMAEAEAELLSEYDEIAHKIRTARLLIMAGKSSLSLLSLIETINESF